MLEKLVVRVRHPSQPSSTHLESRSTASGTWCDRCWRSCGTAVGGERFIGSATTSSMPSRAAVRQAVSPSAAPACGPGWRWTDWGPESTLHLVSIDDHVRRLLARERCSYICSAAAGHHRPPPDRPVHGRAPGCGWLTSTSVAPQPNRVIFANDPPNRELVYQRGAGARRWPTPGVFLVSGFNVDAGRGDPGPAPCARLQQHMAA